MARKIKSRWLITGTLVTETPLHVGGIGQDPIVDLSLAVDGQGNYYIPGTSLAGALRGWMTGTGSNTSEKSEVEQLWGFQQANGDGGHASFILVEDAPIKTRFTEIRDGVGIDRISGTAAEGIKFDRAVLPRGTEIPLELTIEDPDRHLASSELTLDVLMALEQGEISLGGAKTRGLGRVTLKNCNVIEQDFSSFQGMVKTLRGEGDPVELDRKGSVTSRSRMEICIHWQPTGPVMVKAETEGNAVDTLPLTSRVEGGSLTFVIPGSSLKGSLRSQAERIMRTLLQQEIPNDPDPKQRFLNQTQGLPIIRELFGEAARIQEKEQLGYLGSLKIDDCYTQSVRLSPQQWQEVITAEESDDLRTALNNANLTTTQQAFHVAIDRWTGGAADGFLYSTLEPMGIDWDPIHLRLDLDRAGEKRLSIVVFLLLLLRDMAQGRIPIGFGANRGLGAIEMTQVDLTVKGDPKTLGILQELNGKKLVKGDISAIPKNVLETLQKAWQHEVNL
ncbi:MAG: RAMP superfamily CRISPR-associated protein [Synechococcales cyanobacterium]